MSAKQHIDTYPHDIISPERTKGVLHKIGTPTELIHVALFKPEIPPNTGNIARLCAANGLPLHLVGRLGFRIDERSIRRAGLDYWPFVDLHRESSLEELQSELPQSRFFYFSTRAEKLYTDIEFRAGDCLVFGSESRGLDSELLRENRSRTLKIPMHSPHVRSLNLSSAVAIAVYEALRQILYNSSTALSSETNAQSL